MKINLLLLLLLLTFFLSACQHGASDSSANPDNVLPDKIVAVGYGTISQFKNHPKSQQRLLAMRAARLDAYRNLVEEFYGTRIKGHTSVKDMSIESDSYRSYFDSVIRGISLLSITPKGNDVYEAEVELILSGDISNCLSAATTACIGNKSLTTTQYPLNKWPEEQLNCTPDCQSMAYPQVIYYEN